MNLNRTVTVMLKIYGIREPMTHTGSTTECLIWATRQMAAARVSHTPHGSQPVQLVFADSVDECAAFFKSDEAKRVDEIASELEAKLAADEAKGAIPKAMSMLDGAIQAHIQRGANWNYEPYGLTLAECREAGLPDYCAAESQVTRPVLPRD